MSLIQASLPDWLLKRTENNVYANTAETEPVAVIVLVPVLLRHPAFEAQPSPYPGKAEAVDIVSHPAVHAASPG